VPIPTTKARVYATRREATRPPFKLESSLGLYANFYVANGVVLVPLYGDAHDADALSIVAECFPEREVVGILAHVLAELGGMIHCVTQQQPMAEGVYG
jgi:agmatine/peptidylarginine deiminase